AGPVEVRVPALVAGEGRAVGGHDLQRGDVVRGRSQRPPGEAHAAAQREAADADRRARAARDGEAPVGQAGVHVDEAVARAHLHRRAVGRDHDGVQAGEVDDQPALHRRVAGVAVPARAGRDLHVVLVAPAHGGLDFGDNSRPQDGEWTDAVVTGVDLAIDDLVAYAALGN